ncbi:MAG TPA: cysteine--1-D-myo-inosityl 2-amino-2-deoxy-alpha-D-glucopyranoside ligase [Mycobacteriales bacterium]|nr:cysteine--1-D-myo-inosityl 2-amino-2-deoxy-alpha-D-glucopyranoside ligase [Mycobacteriales bacterium]
MQSWPAPEIPRLPGQGRPLRLHDTATREIRPTAPSAVAGMYVCGITPYDAAHIGHAATCVAFDLINRMWRDNGHSVRYVQNVTDVDEPLLERAERDGENWIELGNRETELFRQDMHALRVSPPDHYVGAIEAIPEIVEQVLGLLDAGAAYRLDEDVYFSVDTDPRFGYQSSLDTETMIRLAAENGGDPDRPGKKNPLDPVLWRARRPDEPSWPSPLGPGRPGWHVECTAIALNRLGMSFDVQGGGRDLIFPHHEMSAAHAETLTGRWPFARHYVHAGLIGLDGEKMSKSKGNLVFVSTLRAEGVDPAAIRLAVLSGHYRTDREWTTDLLGAAEQRLDRWRQAVTQPAGPDAGPVLDAVRQRLADDLDTPHALTAVDRWAHDTLTTGGRDDRAPALVANLVDALLGIRLG